MNEAYGSLYAKQDVVEGGTMERGTVEGGTVEGGTVEGPADGNAGK